MVSTPGGSHLLPPGRSLTRRNIEGTRRHEPLAYQISGLRPCLALVKRVMSFGSLQSPVAKLVKSFGDGLVHSARGPWWGCGCASLTHPTINSPHAATNLPRYDLLDARFASFLRNGRDEVLNQMLGECLVARKVRILTFTQNGNLATIGYGANYLCGKSKGWSR